jgi:hypothetical protein
MPVNEYPGQHGHKQEYDPDPLILYYRLENDI